MCSSAHRKRRSRRWCATWRSSSRRAGSASTPSRPASSRPAHSSISPTARRCSPTAGHASRRDAWSSRRTSPAPSRSSVHPTPRWCAATSSSWTAAFHCWPDMEPTDENREIWDKVHLARHTAPPGSAGLPGPVRHSLADLTTKRVLHICCRTGEATEELAALGAIVTGVDPSEDDLEVARRRAPSILWVHAEPDALPRELKRERFELVYCGPGTLEEARDLEALARGIRNALRSGGDLLLFDEHPVAWAVDGLMHWRESYFG